MHQSYSKNERIGVIRIKKGDGYAILLSLLSVVMMYKVPAVNMGLATVLIAVSMVYAGIVICSRVNRIKFSLVIPIYLYAIWSIIRSDGNIQSVLLCIAIMVHVTAISTGVVNVETLKKMIVGVACVASAAVILQQLVHLLFSVHIPFIAVNGLLDDLAQSYAGLIQNGFGSVDPGYRPSAFFLEPAHFAQYCFVAIAILLFDTDMINIKKSIFISVGIICTTSGMGMAMTVAVWGYHYLYRVRSVSISKKIKRLITYCIIGVVAVLIALQIPTVQYAVSRILTTEEGAYNAINGRLFWWNTYMPDVKGTSMLVGLGEAALPDVYFTGIMELIYAYGIVGALLYYLILLRIYKEKIFITKFIALMLGVLMVISNLTGFITLIFYFGSMIALSQGEKKK